MGTSVTTNEPRPKNSRFFVEAGKKMYRAPEMYVPRKRQIQAPWAWWFGGCEVLGCFGWWCVASEKNHGGETGGAKCKKRYS